MNAMVTDTDHGKAGAPNLAARHRLLSDPFEPLLIADWQDLVFLHYQADADLLQRDVPFPLELYQGHAYVSLVSFQMDRLRLFTAPDLTEPVFRPFTRSHFLNVRTYVDWKGEPGIFFLKEFLSNRLSVPFGRPTYGLPYHHAAAQREIAPKRGHVSVRLAAKDNCHLRFTGNFNPSALPQRCEAGSLDDFLLERYTAYTHHADVKRRFRIWHPPWEHRPLEVRLEESGLIHAGESWFAHARFAGAHLAGTAYDVWMGAPRRA